MTGAEVSAGSFWHDSPVLLTGATGLMGGWLVKILLAAKAAVVCLVRDRVPQSEVVRCGAMEPVREVRGDIRDLELMGGLLESMRSIPSFTLPLIVGIATKSGFNA